MPKAGRSALAIPADQLPGLSQRLAPPSTGKELPIRPIHPDLIILAFSLGAPIFLYGIITKQPTMILPAGLILAAFYGFYFWKRKFMIGRFEQQRATRNAHNEQIRRGVARWMKLYYCAQDDVVFEPGNDQVVPADQISRFVLNN